MGDLTGWNVHERKVSRRAKITYNVIMTFYILFILVIVGLQAWAAIHFIRKFW